eukprot:28399_1
MEHLQWIQRYCKAKLISTARTIGICGMGSINIYSISFRYNLEHIRKTHGVEHCIAENANALIAFGKLMVHIPTLDLTDPTNDNLLSHLLNLLAWAMMPLGNNDFGRFQAFDDIIENDTINKWIKIDEGIDAPFPGLDVFCEYLTHKCKQNANCTIAEGQLLASVLSDPATTQIYETETGSERIHENGPDLAFIGYVMDHWNDIGTKWYNAKFEETIQSLKESANIVDFGTDKQCTS